MRITGPAINLQPEVVWATQLGLRAGDSIAELNSVWAYANSFLTQLYFMRDRVKYSAGSPAK